MPAADDIADRLTLASVRLVRWLRAADERAVLTGPQASALSVILHAGRIRMSDLARLEEVSRPTITRLAAELQALGLIDRLADPEDGRVGWLMATEVGGRLLAEGQARRIAPLTQGIEALPDEQRAALLGGLEVLERMLAG